MVVTLSIFVFDCSPTVVKDVICIASFELTPIDPTALTSTTSGKYDYIGCIYNAVSSFWDVVAYSKGF